MKSYTLKSIGKKTDYMTILREMDGGFVVQIVRDMDGFKDVKTDYISKELFDSCIYLPLAFLVFNPIMTVSDVMVMIALQVVIKTMYEILILPVTTFIVKKVSNYELKCS